MKTRESEVKLMRKSFMTTGILACFIILGFAPASGEAKVYLAEPMLIQQPSYAGMRFYVYKPYNMPKGWYATFDGYPVTKNKDGVWVYGTYAGPNLMPTHYIVGSVVPAAAGLSPYIDPVQISSVTTLVPPPVPVEQPSVLRVPLEGEYSTYMPDWLFDDRFMALGRWKDSVDRVGILHRPGVPVAWKGNAPKVIYAWDGHGWYQMMARPEQRPVDVLKENIYVLTRIVNHNGFTWYEADMPVFSQQAATWGYYWMGEIVPQ
jgi:hypothetical protein